MISLLRCISSIASMIGVSSIRPLLKMKCSKLVPFLLFYYKIL